MRIIYLEPFYGGSHRAVADAIARYSSHSVTIASLPAHNWKWRVRGAALTFCERIDNWEEYDLIVSGGMMTISDLYPVLPAKLPVLLYAHETQLTYPSPDGTDLHLAFTDVANVAAVSHTAFNSQVHRQAFLTAASELLGRMPRPRPRDLIRRLEDNSSVCAPGIEVPQIASAAGEKTLSARPSDTPLIIWNHRWEFDKNPAAFFQALREVKRRGFSFRVAVLGENFQVHPKEFERARDEFDEEIVAYGYMESLTEYHGWLKRGDIVVSTANQENFGLSVMEAMAAGCLPLLPNRLSYPEIIPQWAWSRVLYDNDADLADRLSAMITAVRTAVRTAEPWIDEMQEKLSQHAAAFRWEKRIAAFDALFEQVRSEGGMR